MLRAYIDDSGNDQDKRPERDPALALAGFVGPVERWDGFALDWISVLDDYDVCEMHMTDFEGRYRQFKGWLRNDSRAHPFLDALVAVIRRHRVLPFGAVVSLTQFDSRSDDLKSRLANRAYTVCLQSCFQQLTTWAALNREASR
jgi:hypothetical protein